MDRRRSADATPAPLQALPAPPAPRQAWVARCHSRLLGQWQQRSGASQAAAVVLAAAATLALLASAMLRWVWLPGSAWGEALAPALAPLLAGGAGAAAAALLARRSSLALHGLADAARAVRREEGSDEAQLPLLLANPELRLASQSLRRLVDHARSQRRALLARMPSWARSCSSARMSCPRCRICRWAWPPPMTSRAWSTKP